MRRRQAAETSKCLQLFGFSAFGYTYLKKTDQRFEWKHTQLRGMPTQKESSDVLARWSLLHRISIREESELETPANRMNERIAEICACLSVRRRRCRWGRRSPVSVCMQLIRIKRFCYLQFCFWLLDSFFLWWPFAQRLPFICGVHTPQLPREQLD